MDNSSFLCCCVGSFITSFRISFSTLIFTPQTLISQSINSIHFSAAITDKMEYSNTSTTTDEPMCHSCEKQEKDPEVLQAAAILMQFSKDGRLTPTALDQFYTNKSTHVEYCRDIEQESTGKRKFNDPRRSMKSQDATIQSDFDRPMATPRGRIHKFPTPRSSSEADSASSQGMSPVKFDVEI